MSEVVSYPRPLPSSDDLVFGPGEPMESARHVQQMNILITSLEQAWRDRNDFYVGGNMFLYFSETQTRRNDFRGPDVFVALNTTRRERRAWIVWEEDGHTPDVIIELLSESTEHVDRGEKMQIYGKTLKVGEYFLYDPFSYVFEGYELDVRLGAYRRKDPDAEGRLRCEQMDLLLGATPGTLHAVEAHWLRWLTKDGRVLPTPEERADAEARRADAEARRADAEARRARAATEHAEALAAELERLKTKSSP